MPREGKSYYTSWGELCGDEPSVQKNGMTYCCSARCIRENQKQDRPFQCFTGKCKDEVRKINEEKRKEHAKRREEERRERYELDMKRRKEAARLQSEWRKESEKKINKKLIEQCKKRRNTDCDKGAEHIKERRNMETLKRDEGKNWLPYK